MGKSVSNYINNLKAPVGLQGIMTVEHRSNNKKRDFLFCNKIQGKHIPVTPSKALDMFDELMYTISNRLNSYDVLVVGFAETATAIGSHIGENLSSCRFYTQTTREDCSQAKKLIEFREEHSHATEQYLYCTDIKDIPKFNYVLFVEDEISTGKTILNFIAKFKELNNNLKFGVASVCNWQSELNIKLFEENKIDTFALITGTLNDENIKMDVEVDTDVTEYAADKYNLGNVNKIKRHTIHLENASPFIIERTGKISGSDVYGDMLSDTFNEASKFIEGSSHILVLGTEEFMYYPMLVGDMLEGYKRNVKVHATTRSSIDIMSESVDIKNELINKSKIHSAYDSNRDTYIYNLAEYDKVIIVTDSNPTKEFIQDITSALVAYGNKEKDILLINVVK